MVEGSYDNIKITTPDDIALAENILLHRIRRG
jgi:2-C-methyl-D-erythritol 4-phosphate cytidylyltransferase